jgi:ribosomal protein L37AE/L43A
MSKDFKCEACRKQTERRHMRDADGKWVCAACIPEKSWMRAKVCASGSDCNRSAPFKRDARQRNEARKF